MAFTGLVPVVKCEVLSGRACDTFMEATSPHCGNPAHPVIHPPRRGAPRSISNPHLKIRRRPTLIVDEEYDLVDTFDRHNCPDLNPATFDPTTVWVGRRVQMEYTEHHAVSAEQAIADLREFAAHTLAHGKYKRNRYGGHELRTAGCGVTISPDAQTITSYRTRHFELTPMQAIHGAPDRFPQPKKRDPGLADRVTHRRFLESLTKGQRLIGTVAGTVNFGVFVNVGPLDGLVHTSGFPQGVDVNGFAHGEQILVEVAQVELDQLRLGLLPALNQPTM